MVQLLSVVVPLESFPKSLVFGVFLRTVGNIIAY